MPDSVTILKAACDAAVKNPKYQPVFNAAGNFMESFCNEGAQSIANAMDCHELDGLDADQQHAVMLANVSGRWTKVDGDALSNHVQAGGLGFASATSAMIKQAHGHIAAGLPAPMVWSGSLGKLVPQVANVGIANAEEAESRAFPVAFGEPDYFIYDGMPALPEEASI